jgi:hypothetical protein
MIEDERYKFESRNLNGRDHFRDIEIDGKAILKRILRSRI